MANLAGKRRARGGRERGTNQFDVVIKRQPVRPQQQQNKRGARKDIVITVSRHATHSDTALLPWSLAGNNKNRNNEERGESSSPMRNKKTKECTFAALQLATMEGTIKDTAQRERKIEYTRHGSRWRNKTANTPTPLAARSRTAESVSLSVCPSVHPPVAVTTLRQGEDICEWAKFILHLQCRNLIKKCSVLGVSNTLKQPAATSHCLLSPLLPLSLSFSAPPPHKTCLGQQQHAPAPCV